MLPLGSAKSTIKIDNGSMNMPPSNKKKKKQKKKKPKTKGMSTPMN